MICNIFSIDTVISLLATTSNVDVTTSTKFDLCYCGSSTIIKIILVITFGGATLLQHNAPEIYGNKFTDISLMTIYVPSPCQSSVIIKRWFGALHLGGDLTNKDTRCTSSASLVIRHARIWFPCYKSSITNTNTTSNTLPFRESRCGSLTSTIVDNTTSTKFNLRYHGPRIVVKPLEHDRFGGAAFSFFEQHLHQHEDFRLDQ